MIYHLLRSKKSLSPWGIIVPLHGGFSALWFVRMPFMLDVDLKFSIFEEHVNNTLEIGGQQTDRSM